MVGSSRLLRASATLLQFPLQRCGRRGSASNQPRDNEVGVKEGVSLAAPPHTAAEAEAEAEAHFPGLLPGACQSRHFLVKAVACMAASAPVLRGLGRPRATRRCRESGRWCFHPNKAHKTPAFIENPWELHAAWLSAVSCDLFTKKRFSLACRSSRVAHLGGQPLSCLKLFSVARDPRRK